MRSRVAELEARLDAATDAATRAVAGASLAYAIVDENALRAEPLARRALLDARECDDSKTAAKALLTLGIAAQWRGDLVASRRELESALDEAERVGERILQATALDWLGLLAGRQGDTVGALAKHQAALAIAEEAGDRRIQSRVLNNMGNTHLVRADCEAAIDCQFRSLRLKHEMGDRRGEAVTLGNLACAYSALEEHESALECFLGSTAIFRELGSEQYAAMSAANVGSTLVALGRLGEAERWLDESESELERLGLSTLRFAGIVNRARYELVSGRPKDAASRLASLLREEQIGSDPRLACEANLALASCRLVLGDCAGAESAARAALSLAQASAASDLELKARRTLSRALERAGNVARAFAELEAHAALRDRLDRWRGGRIAERFRLRLEAERLREKAASMEALSLVDALTGLPNRRQLDARLATPPAGPRCLAIADLDHFKSVNDTHGHAIGDAVLREAAKIIRDSLRDGDLAARTGGEEFVVVLDGATPERAHATCERLRAAVESADWSRIAPSLRVTTSLGWADASSRPADEALALADAALYRAKHGGRNRVEGENA